MVRSLRRGISPIVATVLMILIAIATGIVVYAFANTWVGSRFSESMGPQAVLVVESAYYNDNPTNPYFIFYIRNDGTASINISRAYIATPADEVILFKAPSGIEVYVDENISDASGVFAINKESFEAPVKVYPALIPADGTVVKVIIALDDKLDVSKGSVYTIKLVATDGAEVTVRVRA